MTDTDSPLRKASYVMSEPHLSGYRLIIGFDTLAEVEAAHIEVAMLSQRPCRITDYDEAVAAGFVMSETQNEAKP